MLKGLGVLYSICISSCDNVYYKVKTMISLDHETAVPIQDPSYWAAFHNSYLVESLEGDLVKPRKIQIFRENVK